jgi:putative intracellular protease/amidase
MNILMVLTSHDKLGDTGKPTGFWLEEFAAPYYVFIDAGAMVTLASPRGGQPPIDPASDAPDAQTADTARFRIDPVARHALAHTRVLHTVLDEPFDAVFYPGGHGPLWDLVSDPDSRRLLQDRAAAGVPLGLVCHAPAVLRDVQRPDGQPLVQGRRVTGFTNGEEAAVGLTEVVPFLLADMLKARGAAYEQGADFQPHVVVDGLLVTGQNPQSSAGAAKALLALLEASPSA